MFDIIPTAFEIDVLAGKGLKACQEWFIAKVPFGPEVDCLPSNQQIRSPLLVAEVEYLGKLTQTVLLPHRHVAMARAACLRFVIVHLAPSPTKEARCCSATACARPRVDRLRARVRL